MRSITSMLFILFLSVAASAQSEEAETRLQVRGIAGWSGFGDEGLIHHTVFGAAADIRLVAGLHACPEILYNIGPGKDRDFTLMPMLSYEFRRTKRVAPFVSGGAGFLLQSNGFRWSNSPTWGFGGGVKIGITKRLFVAPEVRGGWEPVGRAMLSIGYRF